VPLLYANAGNRQKQNLENRCANNLTMPFLIDGHNLIPHLSGLSLTDINDEIALIERLQAFCRATGKTVEVYFDNAPAGQTGTRRYGKVKAQFVPQNSDADTAIKNRLRALGNAARNWTVVSSDRQVLVAAREARAATLPTTEFAQLMQASPAAEEGLETDADLALGAEEVNNWLRLFENGEDHPSD
jgi:predicted RNA-binding protein with PIN domain